MKTYVVKGKSISAYEVDGTFDVTIGVVVAANIIKQSILVGENSASIKSRFVPSYLQCHSLRARSICVLHRIDHLVDRQAICLKIA